MVTHLAFVLSQKRGKLKNVYLSSGVQCVATWFLPLRMDVNPVFTFDLSYSGINAVGVELLMETDVIQNDTPHGANWQATLFEARMNGLVWPLTLQKLKKARPECREEDLIDLIVNTTNALSAEKNPLNWTFCVAKWRRWWQKEKVSNWSDWCLHRKVCTRNGKCIWSIVEQQIFDKSVHLEETCIFTYDFHLTKNGTLPITTIRSIKKAIASYVLRESSCAKETIQDASEDGHNIEEESVQAPNIGQEFEFKLLKQTFWQFPVLHEKTIVINFQWTIFLDHNGSW